jgi:hypothetical protein
MVAVRGVKTKSNLPQTEMLKWNLRKAAVEFGTTADTLKKSLNRVSQEPDADGLYTTGQLVQALFGQLHTEKVRYQRALAEKVEMENSVAKANLLDRKALAASFAELADALKGAVLTSGMPREACENFLHNLATWPIRVQTVADKQSKFRNGKRPEPEEDEVEG